MQWIIRLSGRNALRIIRIILIPHPCIHNSNKILCLVIHVVKGTVMISKVAKLRNTAIESNHTTNRQLLIVTLLPNLSRNGEVLILRRSREISYGDNTRIFINSGILIGTERPLNIQSIANYLNVILKCGERRNAHVPILIHSRRSLNAQVLTYVLLSVDTNIRNTNDIIEDI